MSRFKVNTKFAFPLVLDIGALKRGSNTETSGKGADDDDDEDGTHRGSKKIDQNAPTDKDALTSNIRNNMIWLEQLKTKNGEAKARRRYQRLTSRNPEDVYELYAIVIHSGQLAFYARLRVRPALTTTPSGMYLQYVTMHVVRGCLLRALSCLHQGFPRWNARQPSPSTCP